MVLAPFTPNNNKHHYSSIMVATLAISVLRRHLIETSKSFRSVGAAGCLVGTIKLWDVNPDIRHSGHSQGGKRQFSCASRLRAGNAAQEAYVYINSLLHLTNPS
jgi:hypothetical protein